MLSVLRDCYSYETVQQPFRHGRRNKMSGFTMVDQNECRISGGYRQPGFSGLTILSVTIAQHFITLITLPLLCMNCLSLLRFGYIYPERLSPHASSFLSQSKQELYRHDLLAHPARSHQPIPQNFDYDCSLRAALLLLPNCMYLGRGS